MYETRLLPHESDQIVVSILLTNQSSSLIKELVFSMCDTPAVRLLRAVCNFIDLIMFNNFVMSVYNKTKTAHVNSIFYVLSIGVYKVGSVEIIWWECIDCYTVV
jgi:hypothetical protein